MAKSISIIVVTFNTGPVIKRCMDSILNQDNVEEIIILALTASASFSILDYFIPAMGDSMRNGAGLGLGFNLVGFGI
jgi:hypothetical protein